MTWSRCVGVAVLVLLPLSCKAKEPAPKATPAASVSRKTSEGELANVTLTPEAEKRLGIDVVAAAKRSMPKRRFEPGEIIVPSGGSLQLASPVAATVAPGARLVPGTAVKRGEALLTLVPLAPADRDLRAQTERSVSAADSRLSASQARLDRTEKLLTDGAGSARAVEEARAERDVAKAEFDAASKRKSAMVASPLAADVAVTIRAPHDGVIRQVGVSPGQIVAAGVLLVEVVGTASLWVRVPVFVADVRRVRTDATVRVLPFGAIEGRDALPAHAPPSADPLSSTVDFVYELGDASGLRPGERVRVEVPFVGDEDALVVAASSIMRDFEGGTWVYVALADHVFTRRRVVLDRVEGDDAMLVAGVKDGERIVRVGAGELWGVEFGAGK